MFILKACGSALLIAALTFVLSELGFWGKKAVSALGIVIFFLVFADLAADILSRIGGIEIGEVGRGAVETALKVVGVGHAFGVCADVCSELSEVGIANALTVVGKLEILLIMLPTVIELVEYAGSALV